MANVQLDKQWILRLSPEEIRLVLMALGGRLKDKDIEEAKMLGDVLTFARSDAADQLAKEMEKHATATREEFNKKQKDIFDKRKEERPLTKEVSKCEAEQGLKGEKQ